MDYRNSGEATHFGKGIVAGVDGANGVMLSSNTITAVGDAAAIDLTISGKGTGGVFLGGSTIAMRGAWAGSATAPTVSLPVSGLVYSTITIPGAAIGDGFMMGRSTSMSTALAMAGAYISAANEGTFAVLNNLASTQSIVGGSFTYIVVKV